MRNVLHGCLMKEGLRALVILSWGLPDPTPLWS